MKYKEFKQILLEKGFTFNPNAGWNYAKFRYETQDNNIYIYNTYIEFESSIPQVFLGDRKYSIDGSKFHNALDFSCNSRRTTIKWDIYFAGTTLSRKSEAEYTQILSIIDYILSKNLFNDLTDELERLSKINSIDVDSSMSEINAYVQNRWGDNIVRPTDAIQFVIREGSRLKVAITSTVVVDLSAAIKLNTIFERVLNSSAWVYIHYNGIVLTLEIQDRSRMIAYIKMFENSNLTEEFLELINDLLEESNEEDNE